MIYCFGGFINNLVTKRATGLIMSTFFKLTTNINNNSTTPHVIKFASQVQHNIVSSHATNAADKKNNAHAEITITIHTKTIAAANTVNFSTAVSFM